MKFSTLLFAAAFAAFANAQNLFLQEELEQEAKILAVPIESLLVSSIELASGSGKKGSGSDSSSGSGSGSKPPKDSSGSSSDTKPPKDGSKPPKDKNDSGKSKDQKSKSTADSGTAISS